MPKALLPQAHLVRRRDFLSSQSSKRESRRLYSSVPEQHYDECQSKSQPSKAHASGVSTLASSRFRSSARRASATVARRLQTARGRRQAAALGPLPPAWWFGLIECGGIKEGQRAYTARGEDVPRTHSHTARSPAVRAPRHGSQPPYKAQLGHRPQRAPRRKTQTRCS